MAENTTGSRGERFRWPWQRDDKHRAALDGAPTLSPDRSTILVGGFPIVRTFAHGALGELHLASDPATGLPIALKTVRFQGRELTRERFLRETASVARLHHPNIVCNYAAGIDGHGDAATGWIAMEWVTGSDLSRYTQPSRLLPEPIVLRIMADAADGLAHAHEQGVIHRDIKPANILFNHSTGQVKIADFGCAHLTDAERSRSGLIIGSPVYMAPEQLSGIGVNGRSDLYGLGVVMFQLLTGELPFNHPSMGQTLAAIAAEPAPPLNAMRPDLPPTLSQLVARLLAKANDRRPADGHELARELRDILQAWDPQPDPSPLPAAR